MKMIMDMDLISFKEKAKNSIYIMLILTGLIFSTRLSISAGIRKQPTIKSEEGKWEEYYHNYQPQKPVTQWLLPFKTKNRTDIKTIGVVSTFGSYRVTYLYGHKHTGLDMIPWRHKGKYIYVYPIANGVVCDIYNKEPRQTVLVKHLLQDGKRLFTAYVHLKEIYVKLGQQVTPDTRLGRIYTPKESKKFRGNYYHLHLEVRKSFDDYGCASWLSMTKKQLALRFINPLVFLKEHLVLKR